MANYFLLSVGYWNLVGSIGLYLMLNEKVADRLLRTWTEIIVYPYEVGKYGNLWLLWAATTNSFFSLINLFAVHWEPASQTVVIYGDLWVYSILLLPAIAALKNEDYGKGHLFNILLGLFWILWSIYTLSLLGNI